MAGQGEAGDEGGAGVKWSAIDAGADRMPTICCSGGSDDIRDSK
jgi:hypothetical protein